jgi:hypothetical protein
MKNMAIEQIENLRIEQNVRVNKNRTHKEFKPNDIVFVVDRTIVEGSQQPLRTKFSPSPYVVIKPSFTTTLVKRIADGFTALYSNNDLKKFKRLDPMFNTLPVPVLKVLQHEFDNFINEDFATLTEHDKLDLPDSLELFMPDENYLDEPDIINTNVSEARLPIKRFNKIGETLNDEFEPEDEPPSEQIPDTDSENDSISDSDNPGVSLRFGRRRKVGFATGKTES